MNMRPGGHVSYFAAKGNKRYAVPTQIRHEVAAFLTVRRYRDVNRVAMIKAHALMSRGLPQGADRQRATETP